MFPPNATTPQERRGLLLLYNHYDPSSKALFRGWGWHCGGFDIRFPSDVTAPFPALEKMNFLRVLFRYGVLKKRGYFFHSFAGRHQAIAVYTPHGVGIFLPVSIAG